MFKRMRRVASYLFEILLEFRDIKAFKRRQKKCSSGDRVTVAREQKETVENETE